MAILGIKSLSYGVDDVAECTRFFKDFGLPLAEQQQSYARFALDDGSGVTIRHRTDAALPASAVVGIGVREVVLGVDSAANLERLANDLERDRKGRRDADGSYHCLSDCGLPIALEVFEPRPLVATLDPVNAFGRANRINTHRRWRRGGARPKRIQHVVFAVKDPEASFPFFRDRLGFRLSDKQRTFGVYARCDGTHDHHNLFFLNAALPFPGLDGQVRFHHVNYGVDDLDELMHGASYMQRQGWPPSHFGLGRHRIDSALFFYLPCPAGGEAEYGTDGDQLDDNWVPREFINPLFGYVHFMHNVPDFMMHEPSWDVRFLKPEEISG